MDKVDTHPAIKALEALMMVRHDDDDKMTSWRITDYNAGVTASIDTIRSMIVGEDARIVAARQRLRDAKAIHTIWSELPTYQAEPYAQANMNNIEHIIYSAICYLDGIDGPYLREALATSVEKG